MKETGPLIPSMIVPMHSDRSINWDDYKHMLKSQLGFGITDVIILDPSNWESQEFSRSERYEIINFTVKNFRNYPRDHIIVGSAVNETMAPSDEAEMIKKTGADAIVAATLPFSDTEMIAHFHTMADVMPVIVGNSVSEIGTLRKIAKHPNIIGIRTSPADPEYIQEVNENIAKPIRKQGRVFHVLGSDDNSIIPMRKAGIDGTVSLAANLIPDTISGITKGNIEMSQRVANKMAKLIRTATYQSDTGVAIKLMLKSAGIIESAASRISEKFPLPEKIEQETDLASMADFNLSLMALLYTQYKVK